VYALDGVEAIPERHKGHARPSGLAR